MIIYIQKMPPPTTNYFRYFPGARGAAHWGLAVTAAGFTRIPPGTPYPPARHPAGHHFEWRRGRVLEAFQIVLITAGRGWFETRASGRRIVKAGMAFCLLPNVWHRYRPDPATGWEESWVELQGPVVNALRRARVLSTETSLRRGALAAGLDTALEAVHTRIRQAHPGFDPELAARALSVLAAWHETGRTPAVRSRIVRAVAEAEHHLAGHLADPVNMRELARRLGVAYSHFRRVFKKHTGFAPWQYVLHLRLSQARRLLASRDVTLEEMAGLLRFNSAFHLSASFKRAFDLAPNRWRRQFVKIQVENRATRFERK